MVCRMQRRLALRRRLHILRMATHSQSVTKSSTIMDAYAYIYQLKLKLEAMKRELSDLAETQLHKREVKVVEKGEKGFEVEVRCEKGKGKLVSVLEVFEGMGLSVVHGKVSCSPCFSMEAVVVGNGVVQDGEGVVGVEAITQALLKAIGGEPST